MHARQNGDNADSIDTCGELNEGSNIPYTLVSQEYSHYRLNSLQQQNGTGNIDITMKTLEKHVQNNTNEEEHGLNSRREDEKTWVPEEGASGLVYRP